MFKHKIYIMAIFSIMFVGLYNNEKVEALDSTFRTFTGCTILPLKDRNAAYADIISKANEMGIPSSITDPYGRGTTHQINKDHMINDCLVVYGTPTSIPSTTNYPGTKMKQTYIYGDYIFLGFDQNRRLMPNANNSTEPPDDKYFFNRQFIKYPWLSTAKAPGVTQTLSQSIAASTVKPIARNQSYASPNTIDGKTLTKLEELARVNDYVYWKNSNRSKGKIGYLRNYNANTNVTWSSSALYDYAAVEYYPGKYTAGMFYVYTYAGGTYYYSNHMIPAHQMALRSLANGLKIEIMSLSPQSIDEGDNVTVNYKVTNNGTSSVVNPVVTYYLSGSTKSTKTHFNTLAPGVAVNGSFVITSGNINSNKIERIFVEVNRDRQNPKDESVTSDNIDFEDFGIVAQRTSSNFNITSHSPGYPRSNQNTTVNYTVCNTGNSDMYNVGVYLNWPREAKILAQTFAKIDGEIVTFDPITRTFYVSQSAKCASGTYTLPAPDVGEISKKINLTGSTSNGLQTIRPIEVRNPNASFAFVNKKQDINITERELGDLNVIVTNNMFKNINQNCGTSGGCKTLPESTTFNIRFFDITNGRPGVEILPAAYIGTYNLAHGTNRTFSLASSKTALMNYIGTNKKITKFLVKGYIPYYLDEFDVHGVPMYTDNKEEIEMHYIPERPSVVNAKCDTIDHQVTNHFNLNGGLNLIKACMGHYPNNPSTLTEKGMQSYNYVLYRFLPMPFPQFDVYSPELSTTNPNSFYQTLNTVDDNRVEGDQDSYIFKNLVGSVYKERGRYLPTGVSMKFGIEINTLNNGPSKQIAAGVVSYTIPPGCYEPNKLDLKYHYGCGEIMVFLPNSQAKMMEIPTNYNQTDVDDRNVVYPIDDTKIPYLNPGNYKFKLEATETYQYRYQTNDNYIPNTYNWSKLK